MKDDFEMYERFDDEEDERVKVAKRKFRSGAEVSEGNGNALWNAVVIFLVLVVLVMLFFLVSLNGKYQKLQENLTDLGFSQDGISQSGKVEELGATLQALTVRLDVLEGKEPQGGSVVSASTAPNASAKPQASAKPGTIASTTQTSPAPNATTKPSASAPQAVPGQSKQYTVGANDTIWSITVKLFGDGKRADEIVKLNGFDEKKAKGLQKGQVILVPEK